MRRTPNLNVHCKTLKDVALRLHDEWGDHPFRLHMMPSNRLDEKHTNIWWLTGKWLNAAYRMAKFVVGDGYPFDEGGCWFCGLHVERGYDNLIGKKNEQLASDWIWHRFIPALPGEISEQIQRAGEIVGAPMELHVLAGAADGGEASFARTRRDPSFGLWLSEHER